MIDSLSIGFHRNSGLTKIASAFGIVGKNKTFYFIYVNTYI